MSVASKQKRIFVVDDECLISGTLALILHIHGFEAIPYSSPLEALQAACNRAPDLLISDVVMPEISGIELAIQVQQHCPDCKVLLFSGQAATANMMESARAKGHDFEVLLKPVHPRDFLTKIQKAFEIDGQAIL